MGEYLDIDESTIYKRVSKMKDEFKIEIKIVKRQEQQENQGSEGTTDVKSTPRKKEGMKTRKANARKPKKNQASEAKKEGK